MGWEPPQQVWAQLQPAPSIPGVLSPAELRWVAREGWLLIATVPQGQSCALIREQHPVSDVKHRMGKQASKPYMAYCHF